MIDPWEAPLAQISILGDGRGVLHGASLIPLRKIIIIGLGQSISKVMQFLGQSDGLHQLLLTALFHLYRLQMQLLYLLLDQGR